MGFKSLPKIVSFAALIKMFSLLICISPRRVKNGEVPSFWAKKKPSPRIAKSRFWPV